MNLTSLSIRRPVTTIMLFISLVVIGLIASVRLPLETSPAASIPFVFVGLPYPGSTPEEVERNLVRPVEEALATMPGIQSMLSVATSESGVVQVRFHDWDLDMALAASDARDKLDAIRSDLPDDFRRYYVQRWSTNDQAAMHLRLNSDADLSARGQWLERSFKSRLERLPGVANVSIGGVAKQEILIALDQHRLSAHGIALNELVTTLQSANFSVSAGQISQDGQRVRVQPRGELQSIDSLRDLVLNPRGTRLSDIADIRLAPQRMDAARRMDGKPSIGVDIFRENTANLVDLSRAVRAELARMGEDPEFTGIGIEVVNDMGEVVVSSLSSLAEAGAVGLLLALVVLYAFLRHWPSTIMVSLAIPICFSMTLGFMYFAGITLNILSMMGLLLAVGMLVDNAVVVVESIYQEREKHPGQPLLASITGTRHVAIALSAGTLSHCVVFLPMMFTDVGIIKIFMAQIAVTISVSLLASWLVAISLIPMLSARMRIPAAVKAPWITRLQDRYARLLRWTLLHRGWSVVGILTISLVSIWPIMHTRSSGDDLDPALIALHYQWNAAYTREDMAQDVERVEAYLDAHRDQFRIKRIESRYGEQSTARTWLRLETEDRAFNQHVREQLRAGLPLSARAIIRVDSADDEGQGLSFSLTGDSTEILHQIAADLLPSLSRHPDLRDVRIDLDDAVHELGVHVDRERAAAAGFSAQQVAQFIGMALRGTSLRDFHQDADEIPVNVRFAGAERYTTGDLDGLMLRTADGREIPLLALVNVDPEPAPGRISRINRQTMLRLQAGLAPEVSMEDARAAVSGVLDQVQFPPGYGYTFEGIRFGISISGDEGMLGSIQIALVLIFVIMAVVFESLLFPLAILSCVLFSIFGVFWLFWLTGTEMNVMGSIGILVLMGVVVNNGIVMIEHINTLRRAGLPRLEALIAGSRERLRPILMTMGTAILAMIPIALNTDTVRGMLPYHPMALAIAGGLAFSTVVSLLFLPTIYALLDDLRESTAKWVRKARGISLKAPLPLGE